MTYLGIRFDGDSFSIGGNHPSTNIGVHVEHPWSQCVREFGAPYRIYLHAFGKWLTIPLPFENKRHGAFERALKGGKRVKLQKRCSVKGCKAEESQIHTWAVINEAVHEYGEGTKKLGSVHALLCNRHARDWKERNLIVRLEELPNGQRR